MGVNQMQASALGGSISQAERRKYQAQDAASMPSEGFTDFAGQAIGSTLPYIAGGLATQGAAVPTMMGALGGVGQAEAELSDYEARTGVKVPSSVRAAVMLAGSVAEAAGEGGQAKIMLGMGPLGAKLLPKNPLMRAGLRLAGTSLGEGASEAGSQLIYNAAAQLYDAQRRPLDEVGSSFLGGLVAGPVMGVPRSDHPEPAGPADTAPADQDTDGRADHEDYRQGGRRSSRRWFRRGH